MCIICGSLVAVQCFTCKILVLFAFLLFEYVFLVV